MNGISKINAVIDFYSELCQAQNQSSTQLQDAARNLRIWIIDNKIIEHIFGPNCHVEVIKQSHTILNFVAPHLTNKHIDVIWSACLLKHCGRQVLDLLTSLIRFMKPTPVLHLYHLVKSLDIRDHSEHTLVLTSHMLRYIWSHSPSINQQYISQRNDLLTCAAKNEDTVNSLTDSRTSTPEDIDNVNDKTIDKNSNLTQEQQRLKDSSEQFHKTKTIATTSERRSVPNSITALEAATGNHMSHNLKKANIGINNGTDDVTGPNCPKIAKPPLNKKTSTPTLSSQTKTYQNSNSEDNIDDVLLLDDSDCDTMSINSSNKAIDLDDTRNQTEISGSFRSQKFAQKLPSSMSNSPSVDGDDYDHATIKRFSLPLERIHLLLEQNMESNQCSNSSNQKIQDLSQISSRDSIETPEQKNDSKNQSSSLVGRDLLKELGPAGVDKLFDGKYTLSQILSADEIKLQSFPLESLKEVGTLYGKEEWSDSDNSCSDNRASISGLRSLDFDRCSVQMHDGSDSDASCCSEKNMADFDDDEAMISLQEDSTCYTDDPSVSCSSSEVNYDVSPLSMSYQAKLDRIKRRKSPFSNRKEKNSHLKTLQFRQTTIDEDNQDLPHRPKSVTKVSYQLPTESIIHFQGRKKNMIHHIEDDRSSEFNIDSSPDDNNKLSEYNIVSLSEPGKTLLWDLLQDGKIEHLVEGLHSDIEKVLVNLVITFGDRFIRLKFIEACLENLSKGTSVIVSLRLLPKLMSINTASRNLSPSAISETHMIVTWAERDYQMLHHFFNNFVHYSNKMANKTMNKENDIPDPNGPRPLQSKQSNNAATFGHMDEIITRLSFLTFIFSRACSPETMKLDRSQIDHLWSCLAKDKTCADVLFSWLISQAVTGDFHAVDDSMLEYILKEKLPLLEPETFSMRGLKLLEQLLWMGQEDTSISNSENAAIKLLWDIALKASIPEVSMAAIRILNHFYIYTVHQKQSSNGEEGGHFIDQCMQQMSITIQDIVNCCDVSDEDKYLTVIQRALVLLRTHLEVFRSRYSFYLRTLQLNEEINLTSHRANLCDIKSMMTLRLLCQATSRNEKKVIEIQTTDYIGELRADIAHWWFSHVDKSYYQSDSSDDTPNVSSGDLNNPSTSTGASTFTDFLLENYRSLRLVSHGQEILTDMDERQVNELEFKDMQIIYVLTEGRESPVRDVIDDFISSKSCDLSDPIYPMRGKLPPILLLQPKFFEQLLDLVQLLGSYKGKSPSINLRAQVLSRRVWEVIQALPTSPDLLESYRQLGMPQDDLEDLESTMLLNLPSPEYPQRLIYSIQILDFLRSSESNPIWSTIFIKRGGLKHLFNILISDKLLPEDGQEWNEWKQDCLAYLLRLLYLFGIKPCLVSDLSSGSSISNIRLTSSSASKTILSASLKKQKRHKSKHFGSPSSDNKVSMPQLSAEFLKLITDPNLLFEKSLKILNSTAFQSSRPECCYVAMSSRATLVHHMMNFLSSWSVSYAKFPSFNLTEEHKVLLRKLMLDDPDPSIRRESCIGFHKLHVGTTILMSRFEKECSMKSESIDKPPCWNFSLQLLSCLIEFLPVAESMRPPRPLKNFFDPDNEISKEIYTPGCKDYFWLTCHLVDSHSFNFKTDHTSQTKSINLRKLCEYLSDTIISRETYETRGFTIEDEGLRGFLSLMTVSLRQDPSFKYTQKCYDFIKKLFDCLFVPPNQAERHLPKCKSPSTRSIAFDLMIELVERCRKNYVNLLQMLIDQHDSILKNSYPWDYWPHDDCRNEIGFVGLINLGATCYLATCIQHLFMIPDLRYAILSIEDTKGIRHGDTIRELQKMFAFMLESERKAYNPRNFCKNYTMDHQPLNIAEQKDMTEFLTDLITKMEESSPELRQLIKSLFSGTLSNNVVSLDCSHISRTQEEFYTLRCQVADMRNLYDSLDELTVKDTLEGDNMYTCSKCGKKVRAEKRACIKRLPRILCFNTMRYTFNMLTMTKEKVNTHFSFPPKLNMSNYLEKNLIKSRQDNSSVSSCSDSAERGNTSEDGSSEIEKQEEDSKENIDSSDLLEDSSDETIYELIGVTVHTGTADGGHYYCFIRDYAREDDATVSKERWYLFNDAEVKPFDATHIGAECFGGEMTTKSYDAVNDRFMDFSFEKTNSAYMLFYKRIDYEYNSKPTTSNYSDASSNETAEKQTAGSSSQADKTNTPDKDHETSECSMKTPETSENAYKKEINHNLSPSNKHSDVPHSDETSTSSMNETTQNHLLHQRFQLPKHLEDWIWEDNMKFFRDKSIFEHTYYSFMWQICANIPKTLSTATATTMLEAASTPPTTTATQSSSSTATTCQYSSTEDDAIILKSTHLAISFVLGTLMHSKEKPTITNWIDLLRRQFNSSKVTCDWLMALIDDDDTWLKQILLKCPIEMVRQLFQRLCDDLGTSEPNDPRSSIDEQSSTLSLEPGKRSIPSSGRREQVQEGQGGETILSESTKGSNYNMFDDEDHLIEKSARGTAAASSSSDYCCDQSILASTADSKQSAESVVSMDDSSSQNELDMPMKKRKVDADEQLSTVDSSTDI